MPSRTGTREQRNADDRIRRPFDLVLRLKGQRHDAPWGRWSDPNRAHQAGHEAMRATKASYLPFGKQCTGYRVLDSRTGEVVTDPALIADLERASALVEAA